ncbi:MAG: (2Fe-2S)-binding protein [Methylobacter sp.]
MNHTEQDTSDIVCYCTGTTKTQIKQLVKNGVRTLEEISHHTGACTGCGGCDVSVMELLAEE